MFATALARAPQTARTVNAGARAPRAGRERAQAGTRDSYRQNPRRTRLRGVPALAGSGRHDRRSPRMPASHRTVLSRLSVLLVAAAIGCLHADVPIDTMGESSSSGGDGSCGDGTCDPGEDNT